jgi:hypothetical protein
MLSAHGAMRILLEPDRNAVEVIQVRARQFEDHGFGGYLHIADAAVLRLVT